MRSINLFMSFCVLLSATASAQWLKIKDADYVWGPFRIYNISLFSETGRYEQNARPIMLTLKYHKPVDGRDFAISLARSWSNLGITLPNQDEVVDRLRKILPNIKVGDTLSYIALENKGYFVLNDTIIAAEFNQDFNNAMVAVWLDPRVEIGKKLLSQDVKQDNNKNDIINPVSPIPEELLEQERSNILESSNVGSIDKTTQISTQVENVATEIQKIDETKAMPNQKQVNAGVTTVESKAEKNTLQNTYSQEKIKDEVIKEKQPVTEKKNQSEPELQERDDSEIQISPPEDPILLPKKLFICNV
ncbi:pyruvate formate lyase-activating protein [Ursidibacter arcticus]